MFAGLIVWANKFPIYTHMWSFGPRSQWIIAIDSSGLMVGHYSTPTDFGPLPIIIAQLLLIGLPAWLAHRIYGRHHRRRPMA